MRSQARDALMPAIGRAVRRPRSGDPTRVLILQPDHLGDILLSQPAVRHIRECLPTARLTAIVGPWSETATRMFWPIDDVLTVDYPGFQRSGNHQVIDPYLTLQRESQRLRQIGAGNAVVLRADAWWASWLAARVSPQVVGSDDPRVRPFTTTTTGLDTASHAVSRAWRIAAALTHSAIVREPAPDSHPIVVIPSPSDCEIAEQILRANDVVSPFAVIHAGSGAAVKEWPVDRWRAVASALANDGLAVVCTGAERERDAAENIVRGIAGARTIAGKTSLGVLVATLQRALIVLGPDCGPLHVAVATGTPSIHLFGPSDAGRFGPWGGASRHRVISAGMTCARCGDLSLTRRIGCGCMLAISVEDVLSVTRAVIEDGAA